MTEADKWRARVERAEALFEVEADHRRMAVESTRRAEAAATEARRQRNEMVIACGEEAGLRLIAEARAFKLEAALVSRHGGEPTALLAERDAERARAERAEARFTERDAMVCTVNSNLQCAQRAVAALRNELEDRGCRREGRGCGLDSPSKPCSTCSLLGQVDFGEGFVPPDVARQAIEALEKMGKALNNIGVEFAGPSSNPVNQRDIDRIRAVFERHGIEERLWREALAALKKAVGE